jgi:hypothetical protein
MNPYTHLRTLLDDESKHEELCARLYALKNDGFTYHDDNTARSETKIVICRKNHTTSLGALLPLWPEEYRFTLDSGQGINLCRALRYVGEPLTKHNIRETYSMMRETPALAMLDCLLQVLEYEWKEKPNDQ